MVNEEEEEGSFEEKWKSEYSDMEECEDLIEKIEELIADNLEEIEELIYDSRELEKRKELLMKKFYLLNVKEFKKKEVEDLEEQVEKAEKEAGL